jgi:aspartyl-tRNA(Asn)/glutamyl-tRNA(Gln) amidotransferase subunit A
MTDWTQKTAAELSDAYARGETTALEVTEQYIQRIKASHHNAFLHTLFDRARTKARDLDLRRRRGEVLGPLAGVPIAVKDILATTFAPTTCASRILEGYISPYDATVIERLEKADAIILGKTNMDEFAMGSSNENSAYGPVHNPHAHGYAPGGSSGGSAAAVAGYLACVALGSDTGGSVRQPAAFCGCVGFKPTYGAVSRYGLVAFASSLDQVGPFGRSVADVAALYDVISGRDERDSTATRDELPKARAALDERQGTLKLGVMKEARGRGVADDMNETIERIVELCVQAGHEVVDISLPTLKLGIATYYVIADAEASANLARYDGVKYGFRAHGPNDLYALYARTRGEGFGAEVKRRIMLGTYVLSAGYYDAYYLTALKVRNRVREDFARAFGDVDFLLSPTTPTAAFKLGEKIDDPLAMYLSDVFTVPANLAGIPAVSLPAGKTDSGLPLGIQLWGARWSDDKLLSAAAQIEELVAYDPH